MIKGKAIQVGRKPVKSICGFNGMAGYDDNDVEYWADAKLSFMPKTVKIAKIKELIVDGNKATVIKSVASLYINGMYTFYIKYEE